MYLLVLGLAYKKYFRNVSHHLDSSQSTTASVIPWANHCKKAMKTGRQLTAP